MNNAPDAPDSQGFLATWATLMVVCMAMFIVVLDTTLMNVAISDVAADLDTSVGSVQGAIALYALVMAAMMLTGGKLGDLYGAKRVFIIGVLIFGVGTSIAAVSVNIQMLIGGWSIVEGLGSALLLPLAFTLVFANYRGSRRVLAFAVLGGVQAAGAAVGPIVGGALTTWVSWRLGFGMELAIVLLMIPLFRWVADSKPVEGETLDWVGSVLTAATMLPIVIGVILSGQYGWWEARRPFEIAGVEVEPFGLSITPILIGIGLAFGAAFVHWELRRERRGETPLLRMRIFRNVTFLTGAGTNAIQTMVFAGFLFVVPVFLQSVRDFNALESGLALLPFSVATFLFSVTAPRLGRRLSPKLLIQGGLVISAVGAILLWNATSATVETVDLIIPGVVFGAGAGLFLSQIVDQTLGAVDPTQRNEASGTRNTLTQLGQSLGTAVIGSILVVGVFTNVVDGLATETGTTLSPEERTELSVELEDSFNSLTPPQRQESIAALPPDDQALVDEVLTDSVVEAQRTAMLAIAGFILLALLLASFLPGRRDPPESAGEEMPEPT